MKVFQFRCPTCLKKLFRWGLGSDKTFDKCSGLEYRRVKGWFLFRCPKCKKISYLIKQPGQKPELSKIDYADASPNLERENDERPSFEKLTKEEKCLKS